MDQLQPKTGNLLAIFFWFLSILLVLCILVHEDYKHIQGWNPITTTYFSGRHNNNKKDRENPNNKLGGNFFWLDSNPEHVYGFHEQEDINKKIEK